MDFLTEIYFIILILLSIGLLVEFLITRFLYYLRLDRSAIVSKDLKISVGDLDLAAKLILPKYSLMENGQPKEKLPLIILNTGWNARMDLPTLKSYAISFALGGPYAVLMYDIRGQGKSPGKHQISGTIFEDVVKVIDFGEKLPEIDPQRIGFWGLSLGAEMALTRVYLDERIKVITAVAAPSNPRENFGRKPRNFIERLTIFYMAITGASLKSIPEEVNKIISPEYFLDSQREYLNNRTFLIHAKDDYIVSFSQFEKNRKILNLPDDHVLILEKGGHTLMQQELLIESNSMRFFKSIL